MKIILLEKLVKYNIGEMIEVKGGYARNYLLPRNKALVATEKNKKTLQESIEKLHSQSEEKIAQSQIIFDALLNEEGKHITIPTHVSDNGTLYGGIKPSDIANKIKEKYDVNLEKDSIRITKSIKVLGEYTVFIDLYGLQSIPFKIKVTPRNG